MQSGRPLSGGWISARHDKVNHGTGSMCKTPLHNLLRGVFVIDRMVRPV